MKKTNKTKRIGIDARFYGTHNKGLGRYCQKTVDYLEEIDGGCQEREYLIFLAADNFDLYQPRHRNFRKVKADFKWYGFAEQLRFPFFLNKFKLDLIHFCHFNIPILYRKKFVVTIHDLILLHHPTTKNTTLNKLFYFFKLLGYRWVIRSAAQRAEKVIAVSEYTKQDIIKELKVGEDRIITIYEGVEPFCYLPNTSKQTILQKYGIISKQYLLYIGNAYPHKNLERLVLVYKEIRKKHPELNLVLGGGKDYFYQRLESFIEENEIEGVILAGYIPDQELDIIYKESLLYIFPSLYEGFGLPPLEALTKGVPVVSSNRTCLPEVLGENASYFDPEDENSMLKAILQAIENYSTQFNLKNILKKFSWKKSAGKVLEVYLQLLSKK